MLRAGAAADPLWRGYAAKAIEALAKTGKPFTGNDVWAMVGNRAHTHEPRALGAMLKAAHKAGLIVQTGDVVMQTSPGGHSRYMTVWAGVTA